MPLTIEQIKQNIIDRGRAMDLFIVRSREIVMALKKCETEQRKPLPIKRKIIMNYKTDKLIETLREITNKTETTLTEIRRRRDQNNTFPQD